MNENWHDISRKKEHPIAKNKTLKAIELTKDNAEELSKETDAFTIVNPSTILNGPLSLQKLPVWMIALNPNSKRKKYIFETARQFHKNFNVIDSEA